MKKTVIVWIINVASFYFSFLFGNVLTIYKVYIHFLVFIFCQRERSSKEDKNVPSGIEHLYWTRGKIIIIKSSFLFIFVLLKNSIIKIDWICNP